MATKQFSIPLRLKEAMDRRGRFREYVEMQMAIHDMDVSKPYTVLEDEESRKCRIMQEIVDEQATEKTL